MKEFFDKIHLLGLRNRSYFETMEADGQIRSDGSWKITIMQSGQAAVTLIDGGGNEMTIPALTAGFPPTIIEFGGEPYMVRDDIIQVDFDSAGANPMIQVIHDRIVTKRDNNIYPVEVYKEK